MSISEQRIALTSAIKQEGKWKWPKLGLKKWFNRLSIRQKIGYGYALAIGIAVLGGATGKFLENSYQDIAKKQLAESQELTAILNNLQAAVLQAHTQTPKLTSLLTEPIRLELEYSRFLEYIGVVNRLLKQTNSIQYKEGDRSEDSPQKTQANKQLKRSLQAYIDSIKEYSQKLETISNELQTQNLKPEQIQNAQLSNLNSKSHQVDLEINTISKELSNLISKIQSVEAKKTITAFDKATNLGNTILALSLLSAVAIAAILAVYTSSIIASPLEATTKVARQVTEESNFTLQAPVTTEDEVGQLTTSLNQLIQRVAVYTKELKQAQTQLIQTEKMSSLGQMVAGIAHEINNPVNFIHGNIEHTKEYIQNLLELVELYQQKYPQPDVEIEDKIEDIDLEFITEDLPKTLNSMKIGTERIRQLVLSLRNFSRLDEAEVKEADLHEGIDNTLLILNNRIKDKIKIIKEYGDLPLVACYPAQLNQVFMNIISNGIDALMSEKEQSDKQIVIHTELVNSSQIRVRIRDNGPGITPEIQSKIFDPFFTTKPVGSGTGLGLSISYQIIERHNGSIVLTSQLGEGTEFAIALPVQQ